VGIDIKPRSRSRLASIVGIEDRFGGLVGRHRRLVCNQCYSQVRGGKYGKNEYEYIHSPYIHTSA
jgi:hypothetical protein